MVCYVKNQPDFYEYMNICSYVDYSISLPTYFVKRLFYFFRMFSIQELRSLHIYQRGKC